MGDLKTLLQHQIDAARIVERTLDNFKKIGKAKLTVATVKNRIARLSESFAECQRLHKQLSAVATDAERSTVGYFTQDRFMAVHEIYMETSDYMAETLSRLAAADSSGTDSTPSPAGPVSQPDDDKSRMLMLNLPTFSGAFTCLQGAASDLVENIAITDAGFAIAWDLLVECFENKRLLVTTHLETLYDLPQVHSESADQLRSLRDKANKAIKALQNLDRPVEHWGDLLVFFVTTKLDSESRKAWELKLGDNTDCPTFETLNTFLKSRIRALQTIKPSPSGAASRIADSAATKSSRVRATSLHGAAAVKSPCELCKANHILGQCALFKSKSVEQRVEFAKGTNRCMNCLSPYHSTKKFSITGIGNNAVACRSSTTFTVASCKTDSVYSMSAYVLRSLSNYLPHQVSTGVRLSHIRDLELADDNPFDSAPIELIIGADQYGLLLLEGLRKGPVNEPTAQNTTLGWILSGPVPSFASNAPTSVASFHCNVSGNLDAELRRFWEVEELPFVTRLSPAEQKCEEHFQRTHTRAPNGQYIVRLPFIEGPPIDIGPSLSAANTMFLRQENRLQRNAEHSAEYAQFLREYEALGHMAEVTDTQTVPSLQTVYIPHHAVIREHSATTRLRVVFNASSKTGNGTSLNDHLLIGPKLQTDLAAVILRWRRYRYVFIADIAKMYRQILVDHKDVDYQRILWRSSPSEPLRHYRLLTVTYGTGPAPYLALRVLQQLAKDEGSKYPLAQLVLRDQIYVDDCVFGADDPRLARKTRDHVTALLQEGGFKLRKWASNCPALIADIDPSDHGLAASKPLLPDDNLKVLGINWNPGNDSFRFDIGIQNVIPATKREILSTIARFYDPLGWAAPVVIVAKILMQRLWLQKCDWDETIPTEFRETWTTYCTQLPLLRSIVLPRWTGHGLNVLKTELHGFADASQNAYAAVVYSRVTTNNGEILVSLLAAKSKVAPLKSFTIPRLELCGVVLLSRLMSFIRTSFEDSACEMHGWTDSTITLAWISQPASRWKTFVANRVANIQELVPKCQWHHVISEDNPADCASRGIHVPQFVNHSLWWHGPRWLKSPSTSWPCETTPLKATTEERIPVALHAVTVPEPWDLATRFSSWPKLLRVTAYILRFIKRLQSYRNLSESSTSATEGHSENCPNPSALLPIEIRQARTYWLKHIQQTVLPVEFQRLYGSYTTDAFLACYDRFISRRGLPVAMYSDNGTTFQGADKELTTAFRSATRDPNLLNKLASDQVAWHFIPPSAPHFGGLWEAGFRSMKHHFKRVIGSHTLTFEEMTTVLCQIEACMNSRPIAPRSENIDDYTALTPGHFLIGTAITTVPT
ncbi:uncharacterized protein LOC143364423, partial [Halictus rubicundus]|uniref:uncharacterized protein LOC143364423 n=1 Tax=Halictus rubicundus TaxID=77578 RepID=UPI0040367907